MKITLDLKKSTTENANYHYQKSKKFRKKLKGAKEALQETLKKMEDLEKKKKQAQLELKEKEKRALQPEKKLWYEKFRYFFSSDKFLVIGGKDATSNEVIIKKHLEKNDLVFHASIQGAPFFIIKNSENKQIPQKTLEETAQFAASYSKAWKLGLGSSDIYYITPEQVSKKAPSGEYLGKGAFMISGKKNYFRHTELKIGLGVKVNKEAEVVAGPVNMVTSSCPYSVAIKPGHKKSKELAQEIKNKLLKKANKEDREKIKKTPLDEIQRWIPGGKGMLST